MPELLQQLLQSNYPLLSEELKSKVQEAAKAEKIFVLAASCCKHCLQNIFNSPPPSSPQISCSWLLVLVKEPHKHTGDMETHIEELCKEFLPVVATVLPTQLFCEWISMGHAFAWKVQTQAALIYDDEQTVLPAANPPPERKAEREKMYCEAGNRAEEFLAGANFFHLRKQNKLAVFMLHQAAEQCLRTLLKLATGYHCNTHSIEKLVKYNSLLYPCIAELFPQQTQKEIHRSQLLQKAYIDSRYKDDYVIHQHDLGILIQRVSKLREEFGKVGW